MERRHAAAEVAGRVARRFARIDGVVAVVLAGSTGAGAADAASDIDLYVYADPEPSLAARAGVAGDATVRAIGNTFFEPGDEWTDAASGLGVDVMYRRPAWIEDRLAVVLERHEASVGYSTCFWRNVLDSTPLHDPTGWFAALRARAADVPYPAALREAIVAKNLPLLDAHVSSFAHQLEVAVCRGDAVAANHRAAAWLASFFDVLFALNGRAHPGEKRLLAYAARECPRRPLRLEERVPALIAAAAAADPRAAALARALAADLEALV